MKQIPMLDLRLEYEYMKEDIDSAIKKCLEHQRWILGPEVKELEDKIAEYLGVKHCIGVSSGTDALVLSLRALAIKLKGQEYFDRNDKIITTPFTFTATGDAVLRAGATPVFVDIDPGTYNIDPVKIKEYLQSAIRNPQSAIRGILPVHLYGQACNMDEIMAIAKKYNLFVLEDVAQAFGGMWQGKKLGSMGDLSAFSFFPSKNLGAFGDGGMVSTNDHELAKLVIMLLKHGGKDKYNVDHIGYNARLDTLQAAVLLAKFKYVDEFNDRRRKIAGLYNEGLKGLDGVVLPIAYSQSPIALNHHVFHQYTVSTSSRDHLQKYLNEKNINNMVYYPFPLHKMAVFQNGRSKIADGLKNAELACKNVLSLPIEPLQKEEVTAQVIEAVREGAKKLLG
ncbi:MAG: DegT/DnrJ/EryC1/StrS family aminotransferase [Deltaproteobacteria bacterium]|nr:DegT/DnrJ/EryC1/StrS family aminotransferase [Deltaproteobacteria bacterium]